MLQSWLIFTGSFSFHFAKLPRQNFRGKFCHPLVFFNEREFFTFSTLKTIDARFARAKYYISEILSVTTFHLLLTFANVKFPSTPSISYEIVIVTFRL